MNIFRTTGVALKFDKRQIEKLKKENMTYSLVMTSERWKLCERIFHGIRVEKENIPLQK